MRDKDVSQYMEIKAGSKIELVKYLEETDISVLPRRAGRTNVQVERWVMYRALSTLSAYDLIRYPVYLQKRERPDYLLVMGDTRIGCEITEAVNEEYIKAQSLPEASQDNSVVDASLFKWKVKKRRLDELREIVSRDKLSGPGWAGNSVESEYAQIVYEVTQVKTMKMQKPGYQRFDENELLIYCNQSLPILDVNVAATLCSKALSGYWSDNFFDKILVETGQNIVMYSRDQFQVLKLRDLWMKGSRGPE